MIRPLLLGALVYGGCLIAHPEWASPASHKLAFLLIAGGAGALWLLDELLDFGEGALKILLELAFLAGVALALSRVLPRR